MLIPARNEEHSIGAAVQTVLASRGVELEVLVLDDHSEDATADVVSAIAERDSRVRLLRGQPLPAGWCGKQFACSLLARPLAIPFCVFLDADVRLAPDGLARMAAFLEQSNADLVSGIPLQETGTLVEKLVIPLNHFVLLCFLPLVRMRRNRHPAYAAGCGQFFLARRNAYEAAGGHTAIRSSLHDGITLPRAFRAAGFRTDLCDLTEIATCRMYHTARDVWLGLAKNATEGLASPGMIVPATAFLHGRSSASLRAPRRIGLASSVRQHFLPSSPSQPPTYPRFRGGVAISSILARRCASPGRNSDPPCHSVARADAL